MAFEKAAYLLKDFFKIKTVFEKFYKSNPRQPY